MNDLASAPACGPDNTPYLMRFSTDQFFQMADAGVFDGGAKVELLDGQVFVSPQYAPHSRVQKRLFRALDDSVVASGRTDIEVLFEATVQAATSHAPQPDVIVARVAGHDRAIPVADVMLIVEVSDTTAHRDEIVKRAVYAGAGVAEYWIASLNGGIVHRYTSPKDGDYQVRDVFAFGDALDCATLPGIGAAAGWIDP